MRLDGRQEMEQHARRFSRYGYKCLLAVYYYRLMLRDVIILPAYRHSEIYRFHFR